MDMKVYDVEIRICSSNAPSQARLRKQLFLPSHVRVGEYVEVAGREDAIGCVIYRDQDCTRLKLSLSVAYASRDEILEEMRHAGWTLIEDFNGPRDVQKYMPKRARSAAESGPFGPSSGSDDPEPIVGADS